MSFSLTAALPCIDRNRVYLARPSSVFLQKIESVGRRLYRENRLENDLVFLERRSSFPFPWMQLRCVVFLAPASRHARPQFRAVSSPRPPTSSSSPLVLTLAPNRALARSGAQQRNNPPVLSPPSRTALTEGATSSAHTELRRSRVCCALVDKTSTWRGVGTTTLPSTTPHATPTPIFTEYDFDYSKTTRRPDPDMEASTNTRRCREGRHVEQGGVLIYLLATTVRAQRLRPSSPRTLRHRPRTLPVRAQRTLPPLHTPIVAPRRTSYPLRALCHCASSAASGFGSLLPTSPARCLILGAISPCFAHIRISYPLLWSP
ncbi:hypothetical protein B0H16DRAFT_1723199 [Mycena metata]|uniref:Uncharacterized protein n=1 Tax=Mycena metata TaxID=1033252 RepID=A0AAD7IYM3_9AGAR|nr:hypothetical protein B0H16DRAFT_1723199 [Mycena metata]